MEDAALVAVIVVECVVLLITYGPVRHAPYRGVGAKPPIPAILFGDHTSGHKDGETLDVIGVLGNLRKRLHGLELLSLPVAYFRPVDLT